MNKKITSFLIIIVVIFNIFIAVGCADKNREYDEKEVYDAAIDLIPKTVVLNELFYGYGIIADTSSTKFSGVYYEAEYMSQKKFGIDSVEKMKEMTRACFSSKEADGLISTKLSSILDENGTPIALVRYYQDPVDTDVIMVNSEAVIYLKDKLVYKYDTLAVTHSVGENVYVKLDVDITTEDGKEQTRTIEVALIEEKGEWRINSPTYTTYFDRDKYEDLQNNNLK